MFSNLGGKITALERRAEHLARKLEGQRGSTASLDFDGAEASALEAAIEVLRWFHSARDGETTPVVNALAKLLAVDADNTDSSAEWGDRWDEALTDAQRALAASK